MKTGFIAIVGRANAGKSTLLNKLVGEKVSIVSPKPQTTRDNITGIVSGEDYQIVFIDTPGIHTPKTELGGYMMKSLAAASADVNGVVLVADSTKGVSDKDMAYIRRYHEQGVPVIVALSKIDLIRPERLLPQLAKLNELQYLAAVVPFSAHKNRNVDELLAEIKKLLTDGVAYYPPDMVTDKSESYQIAEIIRECVLYRYNEEIPHGVGVSLNKYEYNEKRKIFEIDADVVCEKQSHKAILIGRGGEAIKSVATSAREKLESYLGGKVFLTLWARVKEDWRNRENLLREFGYDSKQIGD